MSISITLLNALPMPERIRILSLAQTYAILLSAQQQFAAEVLQDAAWELYGGEAFTAALEMAGASVSWEQAQGGGDWGPGRLTRQQPMSPGQGDLALSGQAGAGEGYGLGEIAAEVAAGGGVGAVDRHVDV